MRVYYDDDTEKILVLPDDEPEELLEAEPAEETPTAEAAPAQAEDVVLADDAWDLITVGKVSFTSWEQYALKEWAALTAWRQEKQ